MITTADVKRHAEVIGISLPSEDDLLWIAEAALKVHPPFRPHYVFVTIYVPLHPALCFCNNLSMHRCRRSGRS
jgi:hypothetical protein